MGIPPHTVNIYQKPKQGSAPLDRYPVYNYKHRIAAVGGFDNASFDIALRDRSDVLKYLYEYLGSRVAVYADNAAEPIWEATSTALPPTPAGWSGRSAWTRWRTGWTASTLMSVYRPPHRR